MTQHRDEWDETTPPQLPSGRKQLEELRKDVSYVRRGIDNLDGSFGELAREVARYRQDEDKARAAFELRVERQLAILAEQMRVGFERLGALADAAHRKAETSSHDLSVFKKEMRMSFTWPTVTLILGLAAVAFCFSHWQVPQPEWLIGLEVTAAGFALSQMKPALAKAPQPDKPTTGGQP